MTKLKSLIFALLTIFVVLFSTSFFGCAQKQTVKIYFDYGNEVEQNKMEYKNVFVGETVGDLPLTTPDGKEIDFWVYQGKTITKDIIWWYKKDIVAKAFCLEENEYLCLFDLDGGAASDSFEVALVRSKEDETLCVENPTKEMYNFLGWVENNGEKPIRDLVIDESVTESKFYKAVWERNYSVSINLWSRCEEDTKLDYIYFYWRHDNKDPETAISCWFELRKGETLAVLEKDPVCKELAFKFDCWIWQKNTKIEIDENTVFSEEIFGKEKDIVIIIKSQHNYGRPY